MLTPSESGDSPVVGHREGVGFTSVNSSSVPAQNGSSGWLAAANPNHTQAEQQSQSIVDGVWDRLAPRETRHSRQAASTWAATDAISSHSAESKTAVQHQIMNANQAAVDRQISVEVAQLVASFRSDDACSEEAPQKHASVPYRSLDHDSLKVLRSYLYGEESGVQEDEEALLNHLEKTWREGVRADYEKMVEDIPVFIARERAILTWIELKRHLAALERADQRKGVQAVQTKVDTNSSTGWRSEGQSAPEIERRIQQHRTLMGATQTIIANFDDIGQGFGLGPGVSIDRDELLRQAFVILAGEKYAVEMQWKPVDFTGVIKWLSENLEPFRREEEEEGRGALWYVG
jgi:hypothetical protein